MEEKDDGVVHSQSKPRDAATEAEAEAEEALQLTQRSLTTQDEEEGGSPRSLHHSSLRSDVAPEASPAPRRHLTHARDTAAHSPSQGSPSIRTDDDIDGNDSMSEEDALRLHPPEHDGHETSEEIQESFPADARSPTLAHADATVENGDRTAAVKAPYQQQAAGGLLPPPESHRKRRDAATCYATSLLSQVPDKDLSSLQPLEVGKYFVEAEIAGSGDSAPSQVIFRKLVFDLVNQEIARLASPVCLSLALCMHGIETLLFMVTSACFRCSYKMIIQTKQANLNIQKKSQSTVFLNDISSRHGCVSFVCACVCVCLK